MTVNHRRKVRITTFSVLGALLIAVPVVMAFAANPRGNNPPPEPAGSAPPSIYPSGEPSSGPSNAPAAPDGRLTVDQLASGPIDVPAWSIDFATCEHGRITPDSMSPSSSHIMVYRVVHTNLDDDAALETAAVLICRAGDPSPEQVVGYDRDSAGSIVLLGRIYGGRLDDVAFTRDMTARPEGGLKVNVCVGLCGSDPPDHMFQDREYAWDGSKFVRVR